MLDEQLFRHFVLRHVLHEAPRLADLGNRPSGSEKDFPARNAHKSCPQWGDTIANENVVGIYFLLFLRYVYPQALFDTHNV